MEADFWHNRWQQGQIGFNQVSANSYLEKYWLQFLQKSNLVATESKVFVPLCGKSIDMHWLAGLGHQVFGLELSDLAVESFFTEAAKRQALQVKRRIKQNWIDYHTQQIKIKVGDFFSLNSEDIEPCNVVYDRAALIALPKSMRAEYANKINKLFPNAQIFLITMTYDQSRHDGPPFSVSEEEVKDLFSNRKINLLERNNNLADDQRWRERKVDSVLESVYHLSGIGK